MKILQILRAKVAKYGIVWSLLDSFSFLITIFIGVVILGIVYLLLEEKKASRGRGSK